MFNGNAEILSNIWGRLEAQNITQRNSHVPIQIWRKYTLDFASLTVCPDRSQNSFNTFRTMVQFTWLALANSTKSFAKKRCENTNPPLADFTGFQLLELHCASMRWPSNSIHIMKLYGGKRSPCLIPLDGRI